MPIQEKKCSNTEESFSVIRRKYFFTTDCLAYSTPCSIYFCLSYKL